MYDTHCSGCVSLFCVLSFGTFLASRLTTVSLDLRASLVLAGHLSYTVALYNSYSKCFRLITGHYCDKMDDT